MYPSVREFVAALEADGQLERVREPVSPVLEIAARASAESKRPAPGAPGRASLGNDPRRCRLGGKALLFEEVEGSDIPVLINALGSYRRLEAALGAGRFPGGEEGGLDAIADRIGLLAKPEPPRSLAELWAALRRFAPLLRIPPRTVRRGPCQEVVTEGERVDLTRLPIIKCWPLDGDLGAVGYPAGINRGIPELDLMHDPAFAGRYITFAGIHTIHADDAGVKKPASHNIGMYRVQLLGRRRLAMHWHLHHDGARHWRSWKKRGERMPVAIALGGESVLPFSAIAPLPPGISELLFAGFLNGKGIPMVPCKTVPLRVPANAEIVIEGWVSAESGGVGYDPRDPGAGPLGPGAVFEGPFGDHTGFYSLPDRYPIVEVTAVTSRRDPVFPATVVGLPPQEDFWMGKGVERLFLPLLRTITPDVEDYDLPMFGAFHNCAVMQIEKAYALQGRRMMSSVWGAGQMAWTKIVIVVDRDVDVHDERAVLRAVAERCDVDRDVAFVKGPLDILDHAAPGLGAGTKIGFDATRRWPEEEAALGARAGAAPERPGATTAGAVLERVRAVSGVRDAALPADAGFGWLLISCEGDTGAVLERALDELHGGGGPAPAVVIAVGEGVDVQDLDAALFHWAANMDPGRDVHKRLGVLGFDATPKERGASRLGMPVRDWPPVIAGSDTSG